MENKNGILIPVYRHGKACIQVVEQLLPYGMQIILVDDGNGQETKDCLAQIVKTHPEVLLVTLPKNQGKGGAFAAGMDKAQELGLTHVLQIDADGQHDSSAVPFFFEQSAAAPHALICGYPVYDESAPAARKNGRKFANNWTKVVTWESGIKDALCGFRIYPVEETWKLTRKRHFDQRMGFDIDILAKLLWRNMPFAFYPVRVTYPQDGISNFNVVRDNITISRVFTFLCIGMILRSPLLLARKIRKGICGSRSA